MGVDIDIVYTGNLNCQSTHRPSGTQLVTNAPVDNGGTGASFSPSDLVATALGSCMLTIMGIVAKRDGLPIEGTKVHVVKEMIQQPVRRIGTLKVTIEVAGGAKLSADDRVKLERAAHTCPVHKSLHPDIQTPIEFIYA